MINPSSYRTENTVTGLSLYQFDDMKFILLTVSKKVKLSP
jgi:hypothetical protein